MPVKEYARFVGTSSYRKKKPYGNQKTALMMQMAPYQINNSASTCTMQTKIKYNIP